MLPAKVARRFARIDKIAAAQARWETRRAEQKALREEDRLLAPLREAFSFHNDANHHEDGE
jgi:hypothetical protein